nr:MAG TPA: hypothetical protein [Caudoviricetes sp.]
MLVKYLIFTNIFQIFISYTVGCSRFKLISPLNRKRATA